MFRAWKVPVGFVREEVRCFGPSGRMIFRWGPEFRRMAGMFDLTTEVDTVTDAAFDETGTYVASFIIDDQVVGEIDVPVYVQAAARSLPKDTEDGLKKSDVIWVSADVGEPDGLGAGVVRVQGRPDLRAVAARAGARGADDPGASARRAS